MKRVIIFICCLISLNFAGAQNSKAKYPIIGKACPEFQLENIHSFYKKNITLRDIKGRYTILNFWSKNCAGCIESFPRLNQLKEQFNNKLQIILIGIPDNTAGAGVEQIYNRFKTKFDLKLAYAFDSTLANQFKINGAGINIWIDKVGIVKAISATEDVTTENIRKFITDKKFTYKDFSYDFQNRKFSYEEPPIFGDSITTAGNVIFGNVISVFDEERQNKYIIGGGLSQFINHSLPTNKKIKKYALQGAPLVDLYSIAYQGYFSYNLPDSVYPNPIFQVEDTTKFNIVNSKLYNYYIQLPPSSMKISTMMKLMQEALRMSFGYYGIMEKRNMPCLKLISINQNKSDKIRTKGGKLWDILGDNHGIGIWIKNAPIEEVKNTLTEYLTPKLPVINCTGINGNIDLKVDAVMTDLSDLRKSLNEVGLDLIPSSEKMFVFIIKE